MVSYMSLCFQLQGRVCVLLILLHIIRRYSPFHFYAVQQSMACMEYTYRFYNLLLLFISMTGYGVLVVCLSVSFRGVLLCFECLSCRSFLPYWLTPLRSMGVTSRSLLLHTASLYSSYSLQWGQAVCLVVCFPSYLISVFLLLYSCSVIHAFYAWVSSLLIAQLFVLFAYLLRCNAPFLYLPLRHPQNRVFNVVIVSQ